LVLAILRRCPRFTTANPSGGGLEIESRACSAKYTQAINFSVNMAAESITNRKALRDYHILERYEAGIELKGSEVKSIRAGKANISDAFARIENGEAFVYNADIQPYERASHEIPDAKRVRKLLLHRQEIDKLYGETQVKGRALVVLKLYWKNGKLKAELGVGQGKEARDKRADLKKRAVDRETAREVARFNRKHGT
jgi:SsrA-binding protein